MSNVYPTPSNPWEDQLLNYLMGGMDPTGMMPSMYPAQLGGLWGYTNPAESDADTGTTNYIQDLMQMQMDPAIVGQAGMGAFDPMAFQPSTSYEVIDQPGTRALMQYLNRPGTIEYEIANEILNNGGTASSAIGRLQQAYEGAQGNMENLTPEEQLLFSQLPTFMDMGQETVDWTGLFSRAQELESAALQDPQPGMGGAVFDREGNMVSEGGQREMMFDASGNPQLVEVTSTPSPLGEWARESGLTPPDVEYSPEMILGQDWVAEQQNLNDAQAMYEAAMQEYMAAQGPRREAEERAAEIHDTYNFLQGVQPSPFGEGQTGARSERGRGMEFEPGEGTSWGDIWRGSLTRGNNPANWLFGAATELAAPAADLVGRTGNAAQQAAGAMSDTLTNPAAANVANNPMGAVPGIASSMWDWLTSTAPGAPPPQQYQVQLQPGDVAPPSNIPTSAPGSEYARWGRMPRTAPQSEYAPWDVGLTSPPGSETAPWGATEAAMREVFNQQSAQAGLNPLFSLPGQTGPPETEYPRYQFPGGNMQFGQATGIDAQRQPNVRGAGSVVSTPDVNTDQGRRDFWEMVLGQAMGAGGQPAGTRSKIPSSVRQKPEGEGEGNGTIDLPGPIELLSGGVRYNTGEEVSTQRQQAQQAPEEQETTATGEVTPRARRRNAPTTAELRGTFEPPQSEQRFMRGSGEQRMQLNDARRALTRKRMDVYGADFGRAAAIADWARANGVTPFQQQMLARRMVPLAMGAPQTQYLPGR